MQSLEITAFTGLLVQLIWMYYLTKTAYGNKYGPLGHLRRSQINFSTFESVFCLTSLTCNGSIKAPPHTPDHVLSVLI